MRQQSYFGSVREATREFNFTFTPVLQHGCVANSQYGCAAKKEQTQPTTV